LIAASALVRSVLENRSAEVAASAKDSSSPVSIERLFQLSRDKAEFPAAPANVGVLPIPVEAGIDLSIVASNLTEAENHTHNANEAGADKKSNWTLHIPKRAGIASNRAQACGSPENGKENSKTPEEKRTRIPTKNRRLNGLGGEGLGVKGGVKPGHCGGVKLGQSIAVRLF
jgi:hypothetical protein